MSYQTKMKSPSVRITGLGAVTPYGDTVDHFWQSIIAGKDAFKPITLFPVNGHRTSIAAEIDKNDFYKPLRVREEILSRADSMALAAAAEALNHAGLLDKETNKVLFPDRMAIIVGTAAGGILSLEQLFRKRYSKQRIPKAKSLLSSFCLSAIATNIASEFSMTGPRMTMATVCSSSGLALAAGKELIEADETDYVLVVGAETLSEVTHAGFNILRSVAPQHCQPFDLNRKGLILGEGAGAIILERADISNRSKVPSIAYFNGYGLMTDLHHFTAPHPEGDAISESIEMALEDAAIKPVEIDYVNAHGTGTMLNDIAETKGVKKTFGPHVKKISISSIKSMIGHTMGAASIFEAIATCLSLNHDIIPPTAHLTTPDPECDLDYTPLVPKKRKLQSAISNSFAFGGSNVSLVFQKNRADNCDDQSVAEIGKTPVITGIGVVTPLGIGQEAFIKSINNNTNGIVSLESLGDEWGNFQGGLVDMACVREKIPVKIRRRLNKQGAFLFASMNEAKQDSGLDCQVDEQTAYVYGSAFGCSENVHRFYTHLLEDGPKYTSPQEFSLSVTNSPPSLVSQLMGQKGPIWVVVADEASWDISLHWAAKLINKGKANRVIVSAAEEISGSILAIHHELGMLKKDTANGIILGEGAVSIVLESDQSAVQRGARIYGTLTGFKIINDISCGPQEYSKNGEYLLQAAAHCIKDADNADSDLLCLSPENGMSTIEPAWNQTYEGLKEITGQGLQKICFKKQVGESGASGGMGLAAGLLSNMLPQMHDILVLTSARGGMNAATLIRPEKQLAKMALTKNI
jgi:3-oxoacyl-[acyl-carrier-protein] synthase II